MPAVPPPAFAARLRRLDHGAVAAFVADLWAASGWETDVEGAVVVARRDGQRRRLLVLPPRRLPRLWSAPSVDDPVDRVVVPRRIEGRDDLPRGTPDAPVLDANDLRRRLCYGVDPEAGDALCRDALGIPLRDQRWAGDGHGGVPVRAVGALVVALALGAVALALAGGLGGAWVGDPVAGEASTAGDRAADAASAGAGWNARTTVEPTPGVAVGPTVYVGSFDQPLYAVDAATGERVWSFEGRTGAVYASPTVVNGSVYVADFAGAVYAVDAATGDQEWSFEAAEAPIYSSPTVVDGTVYVGANDERVYAVDAAAGRPEWAYNASGAVYASPTVVDGTVYVGDFRGTVHAVDAETGEREWTFDGPEGAIYASPAVHDGTVYVGSVDGTVYAVDAETGEREWAFDDPARAVFSSPTVHEGTVYVGSSDQSVYAVDAATGEREWRFDNATTGFYSAPTVVDLGGAAGERVFLGDGDANVYALDADTGALAWRYEEPMGEQSTASPTVANGTLYVNAGSPAVVALNATTGAPEWSFSEPDPPSLSAPTVVADPVDGSGVGSRMRLRALGHHDAPIDPDAERSAEEGLRVVRLDAPSATSPGDRAAVRATVANVGDRTRNGTVEVRAGNATVDAATVSLAPGESATVTTFFSASRGLAAEDYALRLRGDDGATALRPVAPEIVGVDAPSTVRPGERATVSVRVANVGDRAGTVDVALRADGATVDARQRRIAAGATATVNLTATPGAEDRTYVVTAGDDRREATVGVAGADDLPGFGPVAVVVALVAAAALRRRAD